MLELFLRLGLFIKNSFNNITMVTRETAVTCVVGLLTGVSVFGAGYYVGRRVSAKSAKESTPTLHTDSQEQNVPSDSVNED